MSSVTGVTDLRAEKLTGLPQLTINIDRQAVARVSAIAETQCFRAFRHTLSL